MKELLPLGLENRKHLQQHAPSDNTRGNVQHYVRSVDYILRKISQARLTSSSQPRYEPIYCPYFR